jgi:3',5'-cyclic AMP phosphodiesterase CpdA
MFKIAHLSDPHLGPLPAVRLTQLFNKRASGYLSWHLNRRKIHLNHILDLLIKDIKAHTPDHIALSGDLINIALPAEYENAVHWLGHLGEPDRVTLVPGNHDAYIRGVWESGVARWSKYFTGDLRLQGSRTGQLASFFPFVRLRRYIAIIGVSTATPTAIGMASGRLGREQIESLRHALVETRTRGFFRVLMIHHPPVKGLCPRRKSLLDCNELLPVLEAEGAELVLFGHDHKAHHAKLASRHGPVHMFGVPSASLWHPKAGEMAGWNLYEIRRQDGSWLTDVTIRALDPGAESMITASTMKLEHRRTSGTTA